MKKERYLTRQLHELLYQAPETERGGIKIYETALSCAQNDDRKGEWGEYLEQTRTHEQVLFKTFKKIKKVDTVIGAARAENQRDDMLGTKH